MSNSKKLFYTTKKSMLSVALSFIFIFTLLAPMNSVGTAATAAAATTVAFNNVTGDGGEDIISMSNERTFEVTVPLLDSQDPQALIDAGITWTLSRTEGIQDPENFPYQKLGGNLIDWKCYKSEDALFSVASTTSIVDTGEKAIKMTFTNKYLYGSSNVYKSTRNSMLDYIGEYTLACKTSTGSVLGETKVRINPYDSYHTTSEFSEELVTAAARANQRDDMYAEVRSMGQSTNGLDMPYIIIAKNKEVLDKWQTLLAQATEDPETMIEQIKNGTGDYQVPVLYSNVHADEVVGADAPMNFIWDLVDSDETNNILNYDTLTGMTAEGQSKIETQRTTRGQKTSSLIKDWVSYLGAITPADDRDTSGVVDLNEYYTVANKQLNVSQLLDDVFFIIVPEENVDGRTVNTRHGGGGVDLNRDNLFQIQKETQNMTAMVAEWNPVTFAEFHGFVTNFQIEPCSPPHEPNVEYDLFAQMAVEGGEAFGAAAVANNSTYNSYQMPFRDYLVTDESGDPYWAEPWDDMSTNYTPQYSMLHGTVAYTIEVPTVCEDSVKALEYGMMALSSQVSDNKSTYMLNVLECFKRGVNNEDVAAVRDWYVDVNDNVGAEADIYRPISTENNNYFPEYYVIPMDSENQDNLKAASEMETFLIRNKVKVTKLTADVTVAGTTYKKGSLVVDMHQAKRNVANAALYEGVLITSWPTLYSEPITAFDKTRGFDCIEIRTAGVFADKLVSVETAETGTTIYAGNKDNAVVISNSGIESVKAVNELLSKEKKVGYITEGEYKGDFAISYEDFLTIKDQYVLTTNGLKTSPICKEIEKPSVYIASTPALATEGYIYYNQKRDYNYNFNRIAFAEQMGFTVTNDITKADVIYVWASVSGTEKDAVVTAVKAGTPLIMTRIGSSYSLMASVFPESAVSELEYVRSNSSFDWLTTVEYANESPVTDSYVSDNDYIMYGYGGNYFTKIPTDAKALVKTTTDEPMEGFFPKTKLDAFKGNIVAFDYQKDNTDITVFANTITNKNHQQDDYGYISNAIFSKMADQVLVIPAADTPESTPTTVPTVAPTVTPTVAPTTAPTAAPEPTVAPTTAPSYQNAVKVTSSASTLYVKGNTGKTATIKTTVPAGAAVANTTYKSSNTATATVNSLGKVTAKKKGNVTITTKVSLTNGEVATIITKITIKKAEIKFIKKTSSVTKGKAYTFAAKAYGSSKKITWKVSNKKIGTISKNGKFTAKKKGTVKVTASSGIVKKTYTIKVK